MKISKNTLDILKNFSGINSGIIVREGDEISTLNAAKTIVAFAKVPEKFPVKFGIYDLNNFISTINLFEEPELDFGANSLTITGGVSKCSYGYAEESVIVTPKKRVTFPGGEVEFDLTKDVFDRIMRASSTLGLPLLCVTKNNNSEIIIKAVDTKNPNGNAFSVVVGKDLSDNEYEFYIQTELMKMIRADYKVSISSRLLCQFVSTDIEYYIAVEKSSNFTGTPL